MRGDEDAELGVEGHPLLHDACHGELVEGGGELGRRADLALSLAVVAEAGGLDDRREPDALGGAGDGERRRRHTEVGEEPLLGDAVLGDGDRVRWRSHDHVGGEPLEGGCRRVLELGGDDRARGGEAVEGRRVVVRRDEVLIGDATGRCGRVGVEDDGAVTHRAGGDDGVPAELAAAEHADRRRRDDRRHVAVGGSVEVAAWAWRSAR